MPAPVYARAFTRTYAQYLGLNARALVQHLPGAKPEPELPPLPQVGREAHAPLVSASWVVAGVVVILVLGLGLLLFWNRSDGGGSATTESQPVGDVGGELGAEQPTPPVEQTPAPPQVQPGIVPELTGQDALVAVDALSQAQIPYILIELENEEVAPGTVFEQRPLPGAEVEEGTVVTLMVSG
jgi:cytoskeletal protein RodZ